MLHWYIQKTHFPLILENLNGLWCMDLNLDPWYEICSISYYARLSHIYIFSQGCRILEWKSLNGIQGLKEGLIWDLSRFTKHKLGWFWTWWMVWDHFSFILYLLYIIIYFDNHSSIYNSMDIYSHFKELNEQGHFIPRKWSIFGWQMVDCLWAVDTF